MQGPKHLIMVPGSEKRMATTKPKFETESERAPSSYASGPRPALHATGSLRAWDTNHSHPTFVSSTTDANLFRGTLYPDAPISEYLPRCKASFCEMPVPMIRCIELNSPLIINFNFKNTLILPHSCPWLPLRSTLANRSLSSS